MVWVLFGRRERRDLEIVFEKGMLFVEWGTEDGELTR
jgi:hypothetical protein